MFLCIASQLCYNKGAKLRQAYFFVPLITKMLVLKWYLRFVKPFFDLI